MKVNRVILLIGACLVVFTSSAQNASGPTVVLAFLQEWRQVIRTTLTGQQSGHGNLVGRLKWSLGITLFTE